MPVFWLTPIAGTENSGRWRFSTIRPRCAWVRAKNEEGARLQVRLATTATKELPSMAGERSPWTDQRMVTCERDDDIVVASGVIRVRDGTLLPVYGGREHLAPASR